MKKIANTAKRLITIWFRHLSKSTHYDFCGKTAKELANAGAEVKTALGGLIGEFNGWFYKEDALMLRVRKSVLTAKIAEAARRLARCLSAISAQVASARYSGEADEAAASRRLRAMLKNYGRVRRKPYNAQGGDIKAILENLEGAYAEDAAKLGLAVRAAELKTAFGEFSALLEERDTEKPQNQTEKFPAVRKGIEGVYRKIATIVDAGAALGSSPAFGAFIDTLNPEIERLNREYHRTKHDIGLAEADGIPSQPHTGEPVTPTPRVRYRKTPEKHVLLVLGKDYNLSYRNNIKEGTAECIIRGKGSYKGSKTVTFVIGE
jgi:hypothetical protein